MILPPTRPSHRPSGRAPRSAEAGIGRPGGLLVAAITAAVVFALGHQLWPRHQPEVPPAPALPPTPAPAAIPTSVDAAAADRPDGAPATPAADAATTGSAPNGDAAAGVARRTSPDAGEAAPRSDAESTKPAKVAPAPAPTPTLGADAAKAEAASARKNPEGDQEERPADKDLARQAWRSNRPDLSADGNKSSILIPLKGSIAGAGFRVSNKPHAVIVTLPRAVSLITMRVYRVNRDGFRLLWINQAEKDADPKDGSSLKLGLSELGDPLVEIKDDFVRVTVHRQAADLAAPADRAAKPTAKSAPARDGAPAPKAAAGRDGASAPAPAENRAD